MVTVKPKNLEARRQSFMKVFHLFLLTVVFDHVGRQREVIQVNDLVLGFFYCCFYHVRSQQKKTK